MTTFLKLLPIFLLTSFPAFADQQSDAFKKAQALSQRCIGCHGEFGISEIGSNPNLAGQNATYLKYALTAYRDGVRKGGMAVIMRPNAASLSDEEIELLANYFSALPGKPASVSTSNQ